MNENTANSELDGIDTEKLLEKVAPEILWPQVCERIEADGEAPGCSIW